MFLFKQKQKPVSNTVWMGITMVLGLFFIGIFLATYQTKSNQLQPLSPLNPLNSLGQLPQPELSEHLTITFVQNTKDPSQKDKIQAFLQSLRKPDTGLKATTIDEKWIDSNSDDGKSIITKLQAKYLPLAFFDQNVEQHPQFASLEQYLRKIDDIYLFRLRPLEYLQIPEVSDHPIRGAALTNTKIIIQEYSSYTCHFCQQMEEVLTKLLDAYPKQLTLVYKDYDRGGPDSLFAQGASCAGEQNKFWEMHDLLFKDQEKFLEQKFENADAVLAGALKLLSEDSVKIGLKQKDFQKCLDSKKYEKSVQDSTAEAINFGAEGTPAFFIGSKFYNTSMDFEQMKAIIEEQLK